MPLSIDSTPDTLRFPSRVFDTYQQAGRLDDVKIIFSLREPISRDISWYNHIKAYSLSGNKDSYVRVAANRTYDEYVREITIPTLLGQSTNGNVENGLYAKYLKTWFELFPRKNILILSYNEIQHDAAKARERVELFLGRQFPIDNEKNMKNWQTHNANDYSGKVLKPVCKIQQELAEIFEPYNTEFYELMESTSKDRPSMEQHPFPRFELSECTPTPGLP